MVEADEKVERLIMSKLRSGDAGWGDYAPPEHFAECPDAVITEAEASRELWFDTGVNAVRLTARLRCPHRGEIDWEWADLGELPDLIEEMDAPERS